MVGFSITHVLLVDDRPEARERIAALLAEAEEMPIDLIRARSLAEAIEAGRADVLLLDSTLPEGSGAPLVMQASLHFRDVPIVVLSDHDESDAPHVLAAGAQDYLAKASLTPPLLVRALRYAMERHTMLRQLERLSLTDELTGLYNRRGFFMLGEQQLELSRRTRLPLSLLYIDVDGLKRVNDTKGHAAGDQLLVDAAAILSDTFRSADITARIGGDEFAVLAQTDSQRPEIRLLEKIDLRNDAHPERTPIRLSIGVELIAPEARRPLGELLSAADARMYARRRQTRPSRDGLIDEQDATSDPACASGDFCSF